MSTTPSIPGVDREDLAHAIRRATDNWLTAYHAAGAALAYIAAHHECACDREHADEAERRDPGPAVVTDRDRTPDPIATIKPFRHPWITGDDSCGECGQFFRDHWWADAGDHGHTVCYLPEHADGWVDEDVCREAHAEVERLRRWVNRTRPVLDGLQELGQALGIPLGSRITGQEALAAVERLTRERDAARAEVERLRGGIEALHFPVEIEPSETICGHCSWQLPNGRFFGQVVEWPCPTAALLNPTEGETTDE